MARLELAHDGVAEILVGRSVSLENLDLRPVVQDPLNADAAILSNPASQEVVVRVRKPRHEHLGRQSLVLEVGQRNPHVSVPDAVENPDRLAHVLEFRLWVLVAKDSSVAGGPEEALLLRHVKGEASGLDALVDRVHELITDESEVLIRSRLISQIE